MKSLSVLLLVSSFFLCAGESSFFSSWKPYRNAVFRVTENGATVNFAKGLSGIQKNIRLEAGGMYRFSGEVKGSGSIMIGIYDGKWNYSREQALGETWKKMDFHFQPAARSALCVIICRNGENRTLEIRNPELKALRPAKVDPLKIAPVRLEAEDYPFGLAKIRKGSDASAGAFCAGERWYALAKFPLPQTSLPIYCHARIRSADPQRIRIDLRSMGKVIDSIRPAAPGTWESIRSKPISFPQTDGKIEFRIEGAPAIEAQLDCVVFTSDPEWKDSEKTAYGRNTGGMVTAGFCATPPVPDGKLDDPAWRETLELAPFQLVGRGSTPARERTSARFCYDRENLYIAFRGNSICLQSVSNQQASFLRETKQNDADTVFSDDAFVLILRPEGAPVAYDWFFNANGAVNDAKCAKPDYWSGRDKTWNSGCIVRTGMEEGSWVLEAAIPWKSLGVSPDRQKKFRFLAGRIDSKWKESSAWQATDGGFHNEKNWGELRLGTRTPGSSDTRLPAFSSGENRISLHLRQVTERKAELRNTLRHPGKHPVNVTAAVPEKDGSASGTFRITDDKPFHYQYALVNPVTLETWLTSPEYPVRPAFTKLEVRGNARVWVNGREGSGTFPIGRGVNQIVVRLGSGNRIALAVGGDTVPLDTTWLYAENPDGKWMERDYDDSKWKLAESADKPGVYRKKLLLNTSVIWPNRQTDALHINAGMIQSLNLYPGGMPGVRTPKGYRVVFDLPDVCELVGASGYYRETPCRTTVLPAPEGRRRYAVHFPAAAIHPENEAAQPHKWAALFLRADRKAKGNSRIRFHAESASGGASELPQTLPLKFLGELSGRQPRRVILQFWVDCLRRLSDAELRKTVYASFAQLGVNEVQYAEGDLACGRFVQVYFAPWSVHFNDLIAAHPEYALRNFNGSTTPGTACPTYLKTAEGNRILRKRFREWAEQDTATHINWDFESSVWKSSIACFCERCRRAFAAEFRLQNPCPAPEEIREKHAAQWVRFVNRTFAYLAENMCTTAHEMNPRRRFSVYSGYQSEDTKLRYSVDWSLLGGKIDLGMSGYGLSGARLRPTIDALGKTPFINGLLIHPFAHTSREVPTVFTRAQIIRNILDSRGCGVLLYSYRAMDGRTFRNIADVSRVVAETEPFLQEWQTAEEWKIRGLPPGCAVFLSHGAKTLGILCNPTQKNASYEVISSEGRSAGGLHDLFSGRTVGSGGTLKAGDAAVFLIP